MIGYIQGKIVYKNFPAVCISACGVGYELFVSVDTFSNLPEEGEECSLFVQTVMKESSIELYGFKTKPERELFLKLNQVSGIGPKVAINILSQINPENFVLAVEGRDISALKRIKGIGKKTAERIILELSGKLVFDEEKNGKKSSGYGGIYGEVGSALQSLGFSKKEVDRALGELIKEHGEAPDDSVKLEELIKDALKNITRG